MRNMKHTVDGIIKVPQGPNHEITNKNIEVVKLAILKVKTWFCDKDLSSLDSIN